MPLPCPHALMLGFTRHLVSIGQIYITEVYPTSAPLCYIVPTLGKPLLQPATGRPRKRSEKLHHGLIVM